MIKNVFERITSFENILQAAKDCSEGRRYEKEQLHFWERMEENCHYISEAMHSLNLPPDHYRYFYVWEPKLRKVIYSDFTTKVIARAIYNVLNPEFCKHFIEDSYSCIKDKGQLAAMQRLSGWMNYVGKSGKQWYYLKLDIEKFFYRIDHQIMMDILKKKVADQRVLEILRHYLCEASMAFGLPLGIKNPMFVKQNEMLWDIGISIGGGLSHMYGNVYLNELDQFCKRDLRVHYYIRFMDDVIILGDSKPYLHDLLATLSDFVENRLHLHFNQKTAIRPIGQGVEFVGYMIKPGNVRLRKSTSLRMKRRLKHKMEQYRDYQIDFAKADQTVQSYIAMMSHCNCDALRKKIFDNLVFTHNKEPYGEPEPFGAAGYLCSHDREAERNDSEFDGNTQKAGHGDRTAPDACQP